MNFQCDGSLRKHDYWVVGIAMAPGLRAPFWAIGRPYQASSTRLDYRVISITNPVYIDVDGDGKYTSPRGYAEQLMAKHGRNLGDLVGALKDYDQAVAAQVASLLLERGIDVRSKEVQSVMVGASDATRKGFAAFGAALE